MGSSRAVVYDVDDLWNEQQIIDYLVPLHDANPAFRVTCYAIPNKLGPVHELRKRYPWIVFGVHGWEHTQFECRAWTSDDAEWYIKKALEMGYDKLFKPPNWLWDDETMRVIDQLGITFHHHKDDKNLSKWAAIVALYPGEGTFGKSEIPNIHTHIQKNPVTDNVENHGGFRPYRAKDFDEFRDPIQEAIPIQMPWVTEEIVK
jgi:hypothetical protein